MIDIRSEKLASLGFAAKKWVPTRPHNSTLWRWAALGVKGHRLEIVRIGGQTYTSQEAIARFLCAINGGEAVTTCNIKKREREIAASEARLAAVGVK